MALFKKKHTPRVEVSTVQDNENRVEVVVNKDATNQALAKAEEANQKLNDLLIENGFTLKIYLAAGGKNKKGTTQW